MAKISNVINFDSLRALHRYITDTPYGSIFQAEHIRESVTGDERFTGTKSYDEAMDLFLHGWRTEAQILTKKLNDIKIDNATKQKTTYDVVGYQASVPRYLQGIPTNMYNKKKVSEKKKIITLVKDIGYHAGISKQVIEKESIKVLHLVRTLETQGYAVNLYIIFGSTDKKQGILCRLKIKSASERLNVSKVAFPLVHPSMLRRILFRLIEVDPTLHGSFVGYGTPLAEDDLKKYLKKGEIFIKKIQK